MALFLNDQEVAQLLPMNECIDVLDQAFAHAGQGKVDINPRSRIRMPGGFFHFMAASNGGHGVFGYKAYPSFGGPSSAKMIVMLYDYETGELLSCMEASRLGQIRTGAASGVATKYMAKEDAATVAVIGSGFQARTQLEAVCSVRGIKGVRVYSRREDRREEFTQRSLDFARDRGECAKRVEPRQDPLPGVFDTVSIVHYRLWPAVGRLEIISIPVWRVTRNRGPHVGRRWRTPPRPNVGWRRGRTRYQEFSKSKYRTL